VNEAAAALGLIAVWGAEKEAVPEVYLWPENQWVWDFFVSLGTQWRHGMSGPTGLDYQGVESVMRIRLRRVSGNAKQALFGKIQLMEFAMLKAWSTKRNG
jgi:hypothetical protein